MRNRFISAKVRSTGEIVTVRKEPEDSLFSDFYLDYPKSHYYSEDELDFNLPVEPLSFNLTEKQTIKYDEFMRKHSHPEYKIGLSKTISFTSTGIGWGVSVKCNCCGEKQDLTDYDTW